MARRRVNKKMVVDKIHRKGIPHFPTDGFSVETNKTLLNHKVMTFSTKVAKQLGFTEGTISLTLVWMNSKCMIVRFKRDRHKGGGWRTMKKDFVKFFDEVGFKKNQGYRIFEVPGLGNNAFEFKKSWEFLPKGGVVVLPDGYGPVEEGGGDQETNTEQPPRSAEAGKWRRSISARMTTRGAASMLMKTTTSPVLEAREGSGVKKARKIDGAQVDAVKKPRKKMKICQVPVPGGPLDFLLR